MKSSPTRAAIGAATLLLTLAVAGCEEAEPADPVTPTGKPIPSATSPSTAPTASTSDATTLEEPVDVVRAWVTAFNATLRGGDPGEATDLTTADCWTCAEHVDPVIKALESGGWFRGGRWSVVRARVSDRDGKTASVYSAISSAGGATLSRRGAEPVRYGPEKFVLDIRLERSGEGWLIAEIVYLS